MIRAKLLKAARNLVKPTVARTVMDKSLNLFYSALPIVIPKSIPNRITNVSVPDQTPNSIKWSTTGFDSVMLGREIP